MDWMAKYFWGWAGNIYIVVEFWGRKKLGVSQQKSFWGWGAKFFGATKNFWVCKEQKHLEGWVAQMISGQGGTVLFEDGKTKITSGYSDKSGRAAKCFGRKEGWEKYFGDDMAKILEVGWQKLFRCGCQKKFEVGWQKILE